MKRFMCDFETATWKENETWVWAWAVVEIGNIKNRYYGNSIDSFMEYITKQGSCICYFHNLKFDGEFLIYYAFTNGFEYIEHSLNAKDNTFTSLISEQGQFYQITFYLKTKGKHKHKIVFYDSLKIIPFAVEEIPKKFNLSYKKLEIDYLKERKIGHKLTKQEINYVLNDVIIVAKALENVFAEGLTKMTRASNALDDYKKIITPKKFEHYFPSLDSNVDADIRKAYKRRVYILFTRLSRKRCRRGHST